MYNVQNLHTIVLNRFMSLGISGLNNNNKNVLLIFADLTKPFIIYKYPA